MAAMTAKDSLEFYPAGGTIKTEFHTKDLAQQIRTFNSQTSAILFHGCLTNLASVLKAREHTLRTQEWVAIEMPRIEPVFVASIAWDF
jgi:hypothetical protein